MVSPQQVQYVSQQVVAAYNHALGLDKAGQKIATLDARGFSTIPADSFWWTTKENKQDNEEAAFINAQVQVQYYKGAFGFGATHQTTNVASLHEAFEQDLCNRLRASLALPTLPVPRIAPSPLWNTVD